MLKGFKRRAAALALALLLALGPSGCYGPFRLTKKIHAWNGKVGEPWLNEGVFVLFVIVPVYEVALLFDAIALNAIELFTDTNPIDGGPGL